MDMVMDAVLCCCPCGFMERERLGIQLGIGDCAHETTTGTPRRPSAGVLRPGCFTSILCRACVPVQSSSRTGGDRVRLRAQRRRDDVIEAAQRQTHN